MANKGRRAGSWLDRAEMEEAEEDQMDLGCGIHHGQEGSANKSEDSCISRIASDAGAVRVV